MRHVQDASIIYPSDQYENTAMNNEELNNEESNNEDLSRYDGKPFLRLLECYVLEAVGQLHDEQRDTLVAMEPKMAGVYGRDGAWYEIINAEMQFSEADVQQIRDVWAANLEKAKELGATIDPNAFSQQYVDRYFSR